MSTDTQAAIERLRAAVDGVRKDKVALDTGDMDASLYITPSHFSPGSMLTLDEYDLPRGWLAFIATAHNDLPTLLAEVERLQALVDMLRQPMSADAHEALNRLLFHWDFSATVSSTGEPIWKQPIPSLDGVTFAAYDELVDRGYAERQVMGLDEYRAQAKTDEAKRAVELTIEAQQTTDYMRLYRPTGKALQQSKRGYTD